MKRRDLVKKLEQKGWYFVRRGGNHDIYTNGVKIEPISHSKEIDEVLAKKILKRNGIV
jgi:predicted RNA binding protein YcfA (HicA-like mRNA interferase family)